MIDAVSPGAVARSALADLRLDALAIPMDKRCAVWGNELPLSGAISLRGDAGDAALAAAVRHGLNFDLPVAACTCVARDDEEILWLAPDEWLILCPREDVTTYIDTLTKSMTGVHHQIVDNSGGFTEIELCGTQARTVLAHCSVYDFSKLVAGRVVGTTFGSAAVHIRLGHRIRAEHFVILVRRSFADYVWRYLVRAASPYGFGVQSSHAPASDATDAPAPV